MTQPSLTTTNDSESIALAVDSRIVALETLTASHTTDLTTLDTRVDLIEDAGISIESYGAVATDYSTTTGTDCTVPFLEWIEDCYQNGFKELIFPPGRWHFNTNDILSELATRPLGSSLSATELWRMTRCLRFRGIYPQGDTQGRYAHGVRHPTELYIHTTDNSSVWLSKQALSSSECFGNWSIKNLSFIHPSDAYGIFLDLGDATLAPSVTTPESFNINIEGCHFGDTPYTTSFFTEDGSGIPRFQTDYDYPLVRISNGYGTKIGNTSFYGGPAEQLYLNCCDRPATYGDVHGIYSVVFLRSDNGGVPGTMTGLYSEHPIIQGYQINSGLLISPHSESGYRSPGTDYYDAGEKPTPTGVEWEIPAGSQYINFTALPASRSVSDYFRDKLVIKVTPSQAGQPARKLIIDEIDDANSRASILYHDRGCYTPVTISSDGDDLKRYIGHCGIFYGDEVSVTDASLNDNENSSDPNFYVCPDSLPLHFNLALGSRDTPGSQRWEIIRTVVGIESNLHGKVIGYSNDFGYPNPSALLPNEIQLINNQNIFALKSHPRFDYFVRPGFGVSSINNQAREMLVCRTSSTTDPYEGTTVPIISANDLLTNTNWSVKLPKYSDLTVVIHCYHPTGGALAGYDGASVSFGTLSSGWNTVSAQTSSTASLFILNKLADLEIAWIGFLINEMPGVIA